MNKIILIGRLVKDPEIRYTAGAEPLAIAGFTLAVDRKVKRNGKSEADFINCTAFGKLGETIEKYLAKGHKVGISGRLQQGSYIRKDGTKAYSYDVIVEELDFLTSKAEAEQMRENIPTTPNDFMDVPDDVDEDLPFY